jgi:hypothetical protein
MQVSLRTISLTLMLAASGCGPIAPASDQAPATATRLSAQEKERIGKMIWRNECGGTVDGLTTWNVGEEFPSLGIGHFIWYPAGFQGRWKESWPAFRAYAASRGQTVPAIGRAADAPWPTREIFLSRFRSAEMVELRQWLAAHVGLQTDFIIAQSRRALPKILAAAPAADRGRIARNYQLVASTPNGTYALIDYVNFKGDGTHASERYRGEGWGLLQVLQGMRPVADGPAAAREFAASAKRALDRRIANSPPDRGENRWRTGWHRRCDTYAAPL